MTAPGERLSSDTLDRVRRALRRGDGPHEIAAILRIQLRKPVTVRDAQALIRIATSEDAQARQTTTAPISETRVKVYAPRRVWGSVRDAARDLGCTCRELAPYLELQMGAYHLKPLDQGAYEVWRWRVWEPATRHVPACKPQTTKPIVVSDAELRRRMAETARRRAKESE